MVSGPKASATLQHVEFASLCSACGDESACAAQAMLRVEDSSASNSTHSMVLVASFPSRATCSPVPRDLRLLDAQRGAWRCAGTSLGGYSAHELRGANLLAQGAGQVFVGVLNSSPPPIVGFDRAALLGQCTLNATTIGVGPQFGRFGFCTFNLVANEHAVVFGVAGSCPYVNGRPPSLAPTMTTLMLPAANIGASTATYVNVSTTLAMPPNSAFAPAPMLLTPSGKLFVASLAPSPNSFIAGVNVFDLTSASPSVLLRPVRSFSVGGQLFSGQVPTSLDFDESSNTLIVYTASLQPGPLVIVDLN